MKVGKMPLLDFFKRISRIKRDSISEKMDTALLKKKKKKITVRLHRNGALSVGERREEERIVGECCFPWAGGETDGGWKRREIMATRPSGPRFTCCNVDPVAFSFVKY